MGLQHSSVGGEDASLGSDPTAGTAAAPVGRGIALLGASNGAAFLAGLVRQKVFAVYLGTGGFGALSLAVGLLDTLFNLARLGIPSGLLREVSRAEAEGDPARADRAYRSSRALLLTAATASFALTLLARGWIAERLFGGALPTWVPPVVGAALPLMLLANLSETMLTVRGALARIAVGKVLTTVVSLALTVALVVALGLAGAFAQIWTGAAAAALVTWMACRGVFRSDPRLAGEVPKRAARATLGAVVLVGAAEAIHHVAVSGNLLIFRVLVVRELGIDANGLYQVVLGLSRQWVPAVLGGVFVALYPRLAAVSDDRRAVGAEVGAALRLVFVLGVPAVLVLLATRDWIVTILLTESFRGVESLIRFSSVGDLAALGAGVLHMSLLAVGSVRAFLVAGIGVELAYLAAVRISIGPFALLGPVASYGLVAAVSFVVYLACLARHMKAGLSRAEIGRLGAGLLLVAGAASATDPGGVDRWAILLVALLWTLVHLPRLRAELHR